MNILLESAPEWHQEALCAQVDPEVWFPEKGGSTKDAKRICARCPVRQPCLDWALANDERFGVYGGLSERERRRLKRPPAAPAVEPATVTRVRHLAAAGLRDPEIGREVGMNPNAVGKLRQRHRIAAAEPVVRGRVRVRASGGAR